jgi:hypothetical protein
VVVQGTKSVWNVETMVAGVESYLVESARVQIVAVI